MKHLWYSNRFFLKKNIQKIKFKFQNKTVADEMTGNQGFGNSSLLLREWSKFKFFSTINDSSVIDFPVVNGIEFARIRILGRSFYKYQVRRMMGAVHKVMKDGLEADFINKTFDDELIVLPVAPADGLILKKAIYNYETKYNPEGFDLINPMYNNEEVTEKYRKDLVLEISLSELNNRTFTSWAAWNQYFEYFD